MLGELEGAGTDHLGGDVELAALQFRARNDRRVCAGERGEEGREGFRGRRLELVGTGCLDREIDGVTGDRRALRDRCLLGSVRDAGRSHLGVPPRRRQAENAVKAVEDVVRGHLPAVVECDALADLEDVGTVVRLLPALSEARDRLQVVVEENQALVDDRVDLPGGLVTLRMRVVAAQLVRLADVERTAGRALRRGPDAHEQGAGRHSRSHSGACHLEQGPPGNPHVRDLLLEALDLGHGRPHFVITNDRQWIFATGSNRLAPLVPRSPRLLLHAPPHFLLTFVCLPGVDGADFRLGSLGSPPSARRR